MDRSLAEGEFYAAYEVSEPVREATSAASSEVASSSVEAVNGGHLAVLTPKSARELAEIYGVSDKSVQTWFKTVCDAYCWLDLLDLKVGTSNKIRYTPLCQQLLADYRSSGMSPDQWVTQVQAENADKLAPPASDPVDLEADRSVTTIDTDWQQIGGRVTTSALTRQAAPIVHFSIENLNITLPSTDTSALDQQSELMKGQTSQAFGVLKDYVTADLKVRLSTVLSQNAQVVTAIQNAAAIETIQDLNVGKPQAESAAGTTS